jgi:hypothetical protein
MALITLDLSTEDQDWLLKVAAARVEAAKKFDHRNRLALKDIGEVPADADSVSAAAQDFYDYLKISFDQNEFLTENEKLDLDRETSLKHPIDVVYPKGTWRQGPRTISSLDEKLELASRHDVVDINTFVALSGDVVSRVRQTVARNRTVDSGIVEQLAKDPDEAVRAAVASNEAVPHPLLEKLTIDSSATVRAAVASNEAVPHPLLEKLANDPSPKVRRACAQRPHTPADLMERLAGDADEAVRAAVADNPRTSPVLLAKLGDDPFQRPRLLARSNPSYQPGLADRCAEVNEVAGVVNGQGERSAPSIGR